MTSSNSQMHNDIMVAGSKERLPMLAPVQLEDTPAIDDTPRNKLVVDTMQVNVQFLEQLQPEWSRFMAIVKKANNLDKTGKFWNQRTWTVAGNRETIGNQEVLHATYDNSGPTFNIKPLENVQSNDEYNVFATRIHNSEQPESINDTYFVEKVDSNGNLDSSDMSTNEREVDQNVEEPEDECLNDEVTLSNPSPLTLEWLKIDTIVLSWIFMTLSKTLQQWLVFEDPQTAKAAWDLIARSSLTINVLVLLH
ncbi:hypothetical protein Tco_1237615 [Tanacetum coccineum]